MIPYFVKMFGVNISDTKGRTPLHTACYFGKINCVVALLSARADPTMKELFYGQTCLHIASQRGHVDTVSYLINNCQMVAQNFVKMEDTDGYTSLDLARMYRQYKVIALLEPNNPPPKDPDSEHDELDDDTHQNMTIC